MSGGNGRAEAEEARAVLLNGAPERFILIDTTHDLLLIEQSPFEANTISLVTFINPAVNANETEMSTIWLTHDAALELARELGRRATDTEHGSVEW